MRFFFDRNMSPRLARMVDIYEREHRVSHHDEDDRLSPKTTDIEWIKILGADDPAWIVLSGDGKILRNKTEMKAVSEAKSTFSAWPSLGPTWAFTSTRGNS